MLVWRSADELVQHAAVTLGRVGASQAVVGLDEPDEVLHVAEVEPKGWGSLR